MAAFVRQGAPVKSVISTVYQMGALYSHGSAVGWSKDNNLTPRKKKPNPPNKPTKKNLRKLAKELLLNPTASEDLLTRELKAAGLRFQPQQILHGYIADFYFPEADLIVELDGACHKARAKKDAWRDKVMKRYGITTLRFQSASVFNGGHKVILNTIEAFLRQANVNRIRPAESLVTASGHCVGLNTGLSRDRQDQSLCKTASGR